MKQLGIFLVYGALMIACAKVPETKPPAEKVLETGPPVETNPANTTYKPAFVGQTRIGSLITKTPYQFSVLSTSLVSPWGIAGLPDGSLLVTEKAGNIRLVTSDGVVGNAISGVPPVNSNGQGGLLGLCADPNFGSNRMIYWAFSENVAGGSVTSVAKGKLSEDGRSFENVSVIYRGKDAYASSLHFGARIAFDQLGNLLVCIGERSSVSTRVLAQSVNSSLGKVIRITKEGKPASGNPIFTEAGALPELYSIGHRNPQGLAVHPVTKAIWLSEFGPRGGDEINLIGAGKNYGWPVITYGIEYSGQKIGEGIQQKEGMEQPVYYWDPVISPSGMTFYSSNRISEWQNNLFVGALSGMHIVRLYIDNNRVLGEERLLASENQRFRDITQGADGALYAVTDAGRLYKIDKK